ncbi:accessory gene regulator ArgB-like protein [Enterococcus rotai]|uniref:accessory gene regulator ArgB-like protein n=1 Tax=Enterococcus rotai TaxID=118060 RepID=UPI0035C71DA5
MENKLSLEEQFSSKLTNWLANKVVLSEVEQAKISYGLSFTLISVVKVSLIYASSILLGILLETLIMHTVFCILRKYSRGFHAKSSFNCGAVGVICFSFLPWLIKLSEYSISDKQVLVVAIICTIILYFRAPANTVKNQVTDKKQRRILKSKALAANLILFGLIFITLEHSEKLLAVSGLVVASILMLPLEKILWRNEK